MLGETQNQFSLVAPKSDEGGLTRAALSTGGAQKQIPAMSHVNYFV